MSSLINYKTAHVAHERKENVILGAFLLAIALALCVVSPVHATYNCSYAYVVGDYTGNSPPWTISSGIESTDEIASLCSACGFSRTLNETYFLAYTKTGSITQQRTTNSWADWSLTENTSVYVGRALKCNSADYVRISDGHCLTNAEEISVMYYDIFYRLPINPPDCQVGTYQPAEIVANFTMDLSQAYPPATVIYSDISVDTFTLSNFTLSNGTTVNGTSVYEDVESAGVYPITHCIENAAGISDCVTHNLTISSEAVGCAFAVNPYTGAVPHTVTLTDETTNFQPVSWLWNVIQPDGYAVVYGATGAEITFSTNQMGFYSATMYATDNQSSVCVYTDSEIYAGVPTPTPTPTTTIRPNVTTIATLATIPTGIGSFINTSQYRADIENTAIGNLTGVYLDTIDNIGGSISDIIGAVVALLVIPFDYITPPIAYAVSLANGLVLMFAGMGRWILVALGKIISGLPLEIQGLVTLGLVYQTLLLAIRGKAGVT